ncbi:hypothetical protein ACK04L_002920 [Enterobacter roggenkampii]
MKNNTQPALKERIEKALEDFTKGRASMHVPPLDTDVDVVLAECSDRLSELEARCAALAAENAGLKEFGDKLYSMYKGLETSGGGFHDEQSIPYQQAALDAAISAFEEIKTPETDASMAELRAQGVESFAESQKEYVRKNRDELDSMTRAAYCGSAVDAERFAAQLRKGVQS